VKKILLALLIAAACVTCCACSLFKPKTYTVALITSAAGITDRSAAQGAYRAISAYGDLNGVTYKEYVPAEDTSESVGKQVSDAVSHGASLLVFAGEKMLPFARDAAKEYPETDILTVDFALPSQTQHTRAITFAVEQAAFLAGYAAMAEGFRSFGFIAGERNDRSQTYFNGFVNGIEYYLAERPDVPPSIKCWYSGQTGANDVLEDVATDWFNSGVQVIFVCGDGLYRSLNYAANVSKKQLIGSGLDQAGFSERYITTAASEYQLAVTDELTGYFKNGGFPEGKAGKEERLGIATDMIGLPNGYGAYRFTKFSAESYEAFYAGLKYNTLGVTASADLPDEVQSSITFYNDGISSPAPVETSQE